jgi:large subunit ribosomal protein L15
MKQNELKPPAGSKHKRKRIGRGDGSGHGSYSGQGVKGQKARSGGGVRPGFEGGQLPITKRLPRKRGFTNRFKTEYSIVNLSKLGVFAPGSKVGPQELLEAGLVKSVKQPIKILSDGEINQPLVVRADKFSAAAQRKIVAAGGSIEEMLDAT